jgi:hypothetical protein
MASRRVEREWVGIRAAASLAGTSAYVVQRAALTGLIRYSISGPESRLLFHRDDARLLSHRVIADGEASGSVSGPERSADVSQSNDNVIAGIGPRLAGDPDVNVSASMRTYAGCTDGGWSPATVTGR